MKPFSAKLVLDGMYNTWLLGINKAKVYAIEGRSSLPLRCHAMPVHANKCACAPMLYISELCEGCTVVNEIDYAWTSIHDNGHVIMACDVWLQQGIKDFKNLLSGFCQRSMDEPWTWTLLFTLIFLYFHLLQVWDSVTYAKLSSQIDATIVQYVISEYDEDWSCYKSF